MMKMMVLMMTWKVMVNVKMIIMMVVIIITTITFTCSTSITTISP